MNGQQLAPMTVGFAIAVVLILVIGFFRRKRNMIAHLAPVKRELKKEKQWLRRGEYNAAMVKGRQNLELFLYGLFLCSMWALGLLILRKKSRKDSVAFVPFLLAAYIGMLVSML